MPNTEHRIYKEFEKYIPYLNTEETNYIENRLIEQIIWYDNESQKKQKNYKYWTIASIVMTALIPTLSLFTNYKYGIIASVTISILSASSSAILSIINLCDYQKLWIEYRSNCETLNSILHRYLAHVGEFDSIDKPRNFKQLVLTCEQLLTCEFKTWTNLVNKTTKERDIQN
ncbi:MAG TPA: hypothetical protein DCW90_13930 [Lachnospiraceae bacterium]|nr:DUF4231 domain-containing protein [uncultured Lachnoclostridium sp.]HAU86542.1 hypothetical protein [Lachnospiraceae bacterium]